MLPLGRSMIVIGNEAIACGCVQGGTDGNVGGEVPELKTQEETN